MKLKNKGRVSSDTLRKAPSRKLNPFEIHINRSKHQVLGRQLKSERGLPGVSKNKALIKRKNTLLCEYKIRGKSNQFIDQRIGERNKNMTEDDRIMARFAAERMRSFNKKAMFNLSDTEVLTHKGQTLSEIERYEQTRSDDEDEDDEGRKSSGTLKGKFVENAHFGGGMLKTSKQDRESLIDQLINESKKRKAERQRNKEETLEATEQLDEEWKNLGVIVTSNKNTDEITQKKDQYDIVMRQLKFEPHGQASQRLKTEEEIAKEDKEQLEKLEKERLKQLREIEFNKYGSHKSADDLDDGFSNFAVELTENDLEASDNESIEGSENLSNIAETDSYSEKEEEEANEEDKEKNEKINEENGPETKRKRLESAENTNRDGSANKSPEDLGDEKSQTSDFETGESTEEESSEDECAMDDFTDLMPPVSKSSSLCPQEKNSHQTTDISKVEAHEALNLPFVFEFPDSFLSFKGLLKGRSVKQQKTIFERLIKSNHPSLDPGNKRKMLILAEFIIELVSSGDMSWASLPVLVSQFNLLKEYNKEECLKKVVNSLSSKLEELTNETSLVNKIKYLTWYIFVFLRPQGLDVLVPVGQPVLNLACSLITQNKHVTLSLLCCSLLLQDAKNSSILYPEAILFLSNCINRISSKDKQSESKQEQAKSNNVNRDKSNTEYQLNLDFESEVNDDYKVLHCCVLLLIDFVKVYRKYPQSKLMFKSVNNSVCRLKAGSYPPTLKTEISELQTLMKVLNSARLPSLAKSTKKPKALRQYEPSFYTVTVGKSVRGLPAEKQEEQKLLHKYKHEMKGAMRELRRDRVFLANVKLKEKALSDEQRIKKVKEIFSSAATQQGELRRLKRKK